jgi:hypothetical protein
MMACCTCRCGSKRDTARPDCEQYRGKLSDASGIDALFDRKEDTYFAPSLEDETHIQLRFSHPIKADILSIMKHCSSRETSRGVR